MNHRGRWRIGALASAVALLGSLASLEVHALSLGKITIQSALGEPLRGEIDITDVNPADASSLKVGLASAETFRAAGMDYPSSATGLEVKLLRRADNRPYLRLNSSRAITEPFMDLIVEANWSSGHVTRDYTMLFDPPRAIASSTPLIAPTAPMLSRPSGPIAAAIPAAVPMADLAAPKTRDKETPDAEPSALKTPAQPAERSDPAPERAAPPAERAIAPIERPVPPPVAVRAPKPAKTAPDDSSSEQVIVKKGDTANKIAARNKPADVSLDQMLVALLKQNPNAFIGGNVNTIKSGAVLDIPKTETVSALSSTEAHKIIVAQSKDFNAFRRKLSESAAATAATSPDRQSGGKVQTEVQDHAQIAPLPDTLKLSQGTIQAGATGKAAENIAKGQQAKTDALRVAELNKNISDLNKLGIPPVTATPASRPAAVPAITVATPSGMAAPVPAAPKASAAAPSSAPLSAALPAASAASPSADAATPASAASAAENPLAAASAPAAKASAASTPASLKKPVVKAPPPPPEPELMDQLMDNAVPLLGGVGILGLLGGFVFMRNRKKKSMTAPVDSSFLESRLQPDSFFGASGGSRVNTNNNGDSLPGGSSMAYTPSQMDASGDVDPVAEADVYLAYGRDEQAEDILKEALHTHPGRAAIHAKLLEIYAKRRDKNAFENLAGEALKLTQGQGPEWAYIVELGNELDPGNPLYEAREPTPDEPLQDSTPTPAPAAAMSSVPSDDMDLDLDMDFSLDDEAAPQLSAAPVTEAPLSAPAAPVIPSPAPMTSPASATPPASHLDDLDLGLDFDMTPVTVQPVTLTKPPAAAPVAAPAPIPELDLLANGLDFTPMSLIAPEPAAAPKPAAAPAHDNGMMEFDLDAFSLDLSPAAAKAQEHAPTETPEEDPLEVKFMLAEEFRSLGDTDGARSLADEVVAKAKGSLKTKAQSFLNELA